MRLTAAFAGLGAEAKFAAAAWSLVHGLANLILDRHLENSDFVKRVIGAIRFAVGTQRSA